MKFRIPFTFSDIEVLKKRSERFENIVRMRKEAFSSLAENLENCDVKIDKGSYLAICFRTFLWAFFIFLVIITTALGFAKISFFYFYGIGGALVFSFFIFINQINYPKLYSLRKSRSIERNLISAMQDMLVQLHSGVPLFDIMVNISNAGYEEVSEEFKKIIKKINSGYPQIQAVEEIGKKNKSIFFKRVLWQISNGMMAGSDMSIVIREGVNNLAKEQSIQIQGYGSTLNPLVMFYMLLAVILPALMITFFTIITSMINFSGLMVQMLFVLLGFIVIFFQIMFLGAIRTRRPSLI